MSDTSPRPTKFRTGGLSPRKPTHFAYLPDAPAREALARKLGLLALRSLAFRGQIAPAGRDAMELTGTLSADVDQACIVTLVPVPAKVEAPVRRRYVAGLDIPEGDEVEMPEDDEVEPMPEVVDLEAIAAEALALALPEYPRAKGAELGEMVHAGDGVAALTDADLKPFAGLASLAEKLSGKPDKGDKDRG